MVDAVAAAKDELEVTRQQIETFVRKGNSTASHHDGKLIIDTPERLAEWKRKVTELEAFITKHSSQQPGE